MSDQEQTIPIIDSTFPSNATDDHHAEYHMIEVICFPFYIILLCGLCIMISFNKRKFKRRYKFDEIFLFCFVYLFNVLITWNFFDFIPKLGRFIFTLALIFGIQHYFGRFQIIGITGGISCGKSTISKYFTEFLKLSLVDCDVLSRKVVEPGKPGYKMIVERFGKGVLMDGQEGHPINRQVLGDIVFNNSVRRRQLTSITNKYIFLELMKEIWSFCFRQKHQYLVIDAPLLFESKILAYLCFPIITVYITDQDEQIRRLCLRDNISNDQALARIKSQMPILEKIKQSDIVLSNDKAEKDLIKQLQNKVFEYLV